MGPLSTVVTSAAACLLAVPAPAQAAPLGHPEQDTLGSTVAAKNQDNKDKYKKKR